MFRIKSSNLKMLKKPLSEIFLFITLFVFLFGVNLSFNQFNISKLNNNVNKNFKSSAPLWGWINFTNYQINETQYYQDDIIRIEGRLFYLPLNISYSGYTINLVVDGNSLTSYYDITDQHGRFEIDYTVPTSGNIYSGHEFEAEVFNPGGTVKLLNYFFLFYRTTCSFNVNEPSIPTIPGEEFVFNGDLRYYNGSIISNTNINYYWYLDVNLIDSGNTYVDPSGHISNIVIPDVSSDNLSIKLSYFSAQVDYSDIIISDTKIFINISCIWNLPTDIYEERDFIISGQVISQTKPSLIINNRIVHVYYNNTYLASVSTNDNGYFTYIYRLPRGVGTSSVRILVDNWLGKNISTSRFINVEADPTSIPSTPAETPYLMFLTIFLPILAGIIIGLSIYGYHYYKKQDKLSRVVNLPLESKLINLKILKDSGRLEESLSYLYNAIYMDLINAKFGRTRKINETIRDFAIISVKALKLNPTTIYPFIQKIEEIIYAKPFQITENDFYKTVNLFSPIYLQLTGYNFILNF